MPFGVTLTQLCTNTDPWNNYPQTNLVFRIFRPVQVLRQFRLDVVQLTGEFRLELPQFLHFLLRLTQRVLDPLRLLCRVF